MIKLKLVSFLLLFTSKMLWSQTDTIIYKLDSDIGTSEYLRIIEEFDKFSLDIIALSDSAMGKKLVSIIHLVGSNFEAGNFEGQYKVDTVLCSSINNFPGFFNFEENGKKIETNQKIESLGFVIIKKCPCISYPWENYNKSLGHDYIQMIIYKHSGMSGLTEQKMFIKF